MKQTEREKVVEYLKHCLIDSTIYTLNQNEEAFSTIYDYIIHGELAKNLTLREIKELHLIYIALVNTFNKNLKLINAFNRNRSITLH